MNFRMTCVGDVGANRRCALLLFMHFQLSNTHFKRDGLFYIYIHSHDFIRQCKSCLKKSRAQHDFSLSQKDWMKDTSASLLENTTHDILCPSNAKPHLKLDLILSEMLLQLGEKIRGHLPIFGIRNGETKRLHPCAN